MSSSNSVRISYAKETTYGVTPSAVKASLVVQDITYTAVKAGTQGNSITVEYEDTVTAGAETVTVEDNAIVVGIESGTSTATQVKAAIDGSADALALVTAAITGTAGDAQVTSAEDALENGAGEFKQIRHIGEAYSGTPETVESQQIRTDRQSSGQVVTGLTVGGDHNFELAPEEALEDYMESAMLNAWDEMALVTRQMTIAIAGKTITAVTGSFITDGLKKGDFIALGGFTSSANNVTVMVTNVTALVLSYVGPEGMADGTGGTTTYKRADKLTIGTTKKSLSIEKAFLDLTNKAILYRGMLATSMQLTVQYGALITGSFSFSGNDYDTADAASEFMTYERYVEDPATSKTLNGSVDMPFLATDITGSWATDSFCIQSLGMNLNNNYTTQNCIGNIAPEDYTPGTAAIEMTLSSYLKDSNWDLLARKLSQDSFGIGYQVKNSDGWYGFYMPAIQVTFDDPASPGANQDVAIDMTGRAKVGADGTVALTIFRFRP